MKDKGFGFNLLLLQIVLSVVGLVLIADEFWMFGVPFGHFLGDWSAFHVGPFHHWMLGVAFCVGVWVLLPVLMLGSAQKRRRPAR